MESIYLIISNSEEISFTYKKIDVNTIKLCDFFVFVRFIEDIINNEKEYIKNYRYIGFTLIFNKHSTIFKNKKIYPIFPIDNEIKEKFLKNSIYTEYYKNSTNLDETKYKEEIYKIKNDYEKIIKKLEKKIKELENKK